MKQSGGLKKFVAAKVKQAKTLVTGDKGRALEPFWKVRGYNLLHVCIAGTKKRDLSEKVLVGLKPFHVGLLISAQE
jgi:hypothetical protein